MRPKPIWIKQVETMKVLMMVHTCKHRCASPSSNATLVHSRQCRKAVSCVHACLSSFVQLICEDIQHQLAVAVGIYVPICLLVQKALELRSVDQVAVMRKADSIWAVDVEWLRFRIGATSSSGIPQVSKTHEAWEICNPGPIMKDFGSHAFALTLIDPPAIRACNDTTRILATMLEEVERIMYFHGSRRGLVGVDNGNDTTHGEGGESRFYSQRHWSATGQ